MQNIFTGNIAYFMGLFFLSCGLGCGVEATENKVENESIIKKLDQDQDGLISIKESIADPNLLAIFGSIDRNSDGFISKLELDQFEKLTNKVKVASTN